MLLTVDELNRFAELRRRLFDAIGKNLDGCKSYEGRLSILFPDYFHDRGRDTNREEINNKYGIHLYCYVIGPRRHSDWFGPTFQDALASAERDINEWIQQAENELTED